MEPTKTETTTLPELPKDMAKEISDAYSEAFNIEDVTKRSKALDLIKRGEEEVKKYYTVPTEHDNTLLETGLKVADTLGSGPFRSALAVPAVLAGKMSAREGLAGLNITTSQPAPSGERLTQVYNIPKMGEYKDIAPSEDVLNAYANEIQPGSGYILPTHLMSKEGPLQNVSGRDVLAGAVDILGPSPIGPASKLLKAPIGKLSGAFPKTTSAIETISSVIKKPIGKMLESAEGLNTFPRADKAAIKAGKGSTGAFAGNILEKPVSEIMVPKLGVSGGKNALKVYEETMQDAGAKAAELVDEAHNVGMANQFIKGSTDHVVPFDSFTRAARERAYQQSMQPGVVGREGKDALAYLDDLEGKNIVQQKVVQPNPNEVRGLDPSREALPKPRKEVIEIGGDEYALHSFTDPTTGQTIRGVGLKDAQKLKQYFQKQQAPTWKATAKSTTSIMDDVEKDLAVGLQREVENKVNKVLPEKAGVLKEYNRVYGTLLSGEQGFINDVMNTGTMTEKMAALAAAGAGGALSYKQHSTIPALLAVGAVGAKNTQLGRSMVGNAARVAQKMPWDSMIRAGLLERNNVNPYDELLRQREKAGMTSRSTFKKQGGK